MTLPWLADVLRAAGLTVVEHADWRTHDRPGDWSPRYGVVHATAAPRSQSDDVQVRVVRDGRSDLPGPIANAVVDRLGRWHVVSAGRCNSTLVGTAGPFEGWGNTYALSTEACNDNLTEPWPDVQYRSYVRGWAAWCRRLGWTASKLVGHKEHTPGRKTDPTFSMAKFRADVAAVLAGEDDDVSAADVWATEWQGVDRAYPASTWLINANKYAAAAVAEAKAARAELAALRTVVETLADAVKAGGGSVDTAAILAGVDERLTALREQVADEIAGRLAS